MYHKWQSYYVWFLRNEAWRTEIFVILYHYLPFYPRNNPTNQNFKKMKKPPGDIILHKCTENRDHMLYCSWDTMRDGCNSYFLFWAIFCPFTLLTTQKIKISKKWKQHLEISSFYTCVPKIMITWYMLPEILCATDGWTDGHTDGRKKWHIEVGAPPKKINLPTNLKKNLINI